MQYLTVVSFGIFWREIEGAERQERWLKSGVVGDCLAAISAARTQTTAEMGLRGDTNCVKKRTLFQGFTILLSTYC